MNAPRSVSTALQREQPLLADLSERRGDGRGLRRGGARLLVGGTLIAVFALMAAFGPMLAPYDPLKPDYAVSLQGPSWQHPLGTDALGRDVLSRIIVGTRMAFVISAVAVSTSVIVGLTLGLLAAYVRGTVDLAIGVVVDSLLTLPTLVIVLAVVAAFGPSVGSMMAAIGLASAPIMLRVTRAQALGVLGSPFIEAAESVGASHVRIVLRHLLPNVIASVMVLASLRMGGAILAEASLSFLGLGLPPPDPTWGSMANYGRQYFVTAPWLVFGPIGAIFLLVMAWNMAGDGVRDVLDPRLRG